MSNINNLKNIMFDLGGVLFPLSISATTDAYERNGAKDAAETFEKKLCDETDIAYRYTTGTCTSAEYRAFCNNVFNTNMDDETFDNCWNAMILCYPDENRILLQKLKDSGYNLYVLSNINEIHVNYVEKLAQWPDGLFIKRYYSNEIHFAKPFENCFQYVINDSGMNPAETLYIDDRDDNIATAKKLGFNTIHLTDPYSLTEQLNKYIK